MAVLVAFLAAVAMAVTGGPQAPFTQWALPQASASSATHGSGQVVTGGSAKSGVPAASSGAVTPGQPATGSPSASPSASAKPSPTASPSPSGSVSPAASPTATTKGHGHANPHSSKSPKPKS